MHIVLADDHRLVLDSMRSFLREFRPDMEVSKATDFRRAMEIAACGRAVDLLVLDLNMPGMNGLQGLVEAKRRFPDLPVVLISGQFGSNQVREALTCGASGFIPKDLAGEAMVKALELVLSGGVYVPMVALSGESEDTESEAGTHHKDDELLSLLTKREYEAMTLLAQGRPNKIIASELNLTESTVAFHLRSIYRKLDVSSRTEAMRAAMDLGLTVKAMDA